MTNYYYLKIHRLANLFNIVSLKLIQCNSSIILFILRISYKLLIFICFLEFYLILLKFYN